MCRYDEGQLWATAGCAGRIDRRGRRRNRALVCSNARLVQRRRAIRTDRRAAMTKETGLKLVLAAQLEASSSAMGPGRRECGRFV